MKVFRSIKKQQQYSFKEKCKGRVIGFVPTMGFLHKGHLSLIDKAKELSDRVIISIFVNPLQFAPNEDYREYPRDEKMDLKLLEEKGVDAVLIPELNEMYPNGFETYVEVSKLSKDYCGRSRPLFFRGVATIVLKLFNTVQPDLAVFGEKDYQQYIIIKRMSRDLNLPISVIPSPIVREEDGLAMSSRNLYLTPSERKEAPVLYESMRRAKELASKGERNVKNLKKEMVKFIESKKYPRIDYIEFVDPENLKRAKILQGPTRILLAVWIGKARLIDNMEV
ncbi:MAG: pantoate--beta-alanine ligase [candidate division WOR-3 bacterium]|nr:pantoate--beta-alanine ligase [candidate division WOR-3 bacterium]